MKPLASVNMTNAAKGWLALAIFAMAAGLWLAWPEQVPSYAGRPLSSWFYDLCSGVHGGTAQAQGFRAAYAEFAKMDSNAVPYLVKQLRYGRTGVSEKVVLRLRHFALTKPLARNWVLPSSRRQYAAVALRQIGPRADAAVPALMEASVQDRPDVGLNAIVALQSILFGKTSDSFSPVELREMQSRTLAEAARRDPKTAHRLGISQ